MYTARVMSRSATEYNQVHLLDCTYVLILDIEFYNLLRIIYYDLNVLILYLEYFIFLLLYL